MADTVTMPEAEFEALLSVHQAVGRASTYEGLATYFAAKSGEFYANRQDVLAGYLREVVVPMMRRRGEEERKEQARQQATADAAKAKES